MAVSKRTRYEVLNRDNFTCRYCGQSAPDVKLHVDHVMPVALGGADTPDNLVAACMDCNAGKASTHPNAETVGQVSDDTILLAEAMKRAAQEMDHKLAQDADAKAKATKQLMEVLASCAGVPSFATVCEQIDVPDDWLRTCLAFLDRGLPIRVLGDAFEVAWTARTVADKDVWRYFCGVCWNRLRELEARAREIYEAQA